MAKQNDIVIVVDDEDNVIKYLDVALVTQDMRRRDTAIFLQNNQGQVLLARWHPNKRILPNMWACSASGTVESHETYEQNAVKELEEEIGVANVELRHIGNYCIDYTEHKRFTGVFYGKYNGDIKDLRLEENEVAETRWATVEQIEKELANTPEIFAPGMQLLLDIALQPAPPERAILVDAKDNIIGPILRSELKENDNFRICTIIVDDGKGNVLLQKRCANKYAGPNLYENAAGGVVSFGETYAQSARRELFEEIGLYGLPLIDLGVHTVHTPWGLRLTNWYRVMCDYPLDKFRPQPSEVAELKWISKTELLEWYAKEPQVFMPSCALWHELLV